MYYLITGYKTNSEKEEIKDLRLYCYDLRHGDDGDISTIEKGVLVNRAGSIVTDEELTFGNTSMTDMIDFEEFVKNNEEVDSLAELVCINMKKQEELNYYAFCIGYDFLNNFFQTSEYAECDIVNEECKKLAKQFMKSSNYKNMENSGYENLEEWLEENKEKIKRDYIGEPSKPLKKEREAR